MIQQFDLVLQKSYPLKVSFSLDEIIECFDVFQVNSFEAMEDLKGKLITQLHTRVNQPIMKFIANFPKQINDPLYLNYLDLLEDFAKQKAEKYLQNMTKQHGDQMNNQFSFNSYNSQYASYIKVEDILNIELSQIKQKINEKKLPHPDFIGSKIKACPYCGELWVKEYDCNKILCGASAGKYSPTLKLKPLVKFEFKIEDKKVILIENDVQLFKNENELINELKNSFYKRYIKQILETINIKCDYELIYLLQKELGKSCFNQWIQMIDKSNYNELIQTIIELLKVNINMAKEVTKSKFGCGNYFEWSKAKLLTKEQTSKFQLIIFKTQREDSAIDDNDQNKKKLIEWLNGEQDRQNEEINKYINNMEIAQQKQNKTIF